MTPQRDFDRQLHDWMQDVPRIHPNLEVAILEQTRRMPQQRRSRWSFGVPASASLRNAARVLGGVAGILVVGLIGFVLLSVLTAPQDGPVVPAASGSPATTAGPESTTSSPDPSPDTLRTPEVRPSLVPTAALRSFERTMSEVSMEPLQAGVERLAADGEGKEFITWRSSFAGSSDVAFRPVAGPALDTDGFVWLAGYRQTGAIRLFQLGRAGKAILDTALGNNDEGLWMRTDGDGGLWVGGANDINHFDGQTWYWPHHPVVQDVHAVQVMPDGSAWVVWTRDMGPAAGRLSRLTREAWVNHEAEVAEALGVDSSALAFGDLAIAPDGELRAVVNVASSAGDGAATSQVAWNGQAWSFVAPAEDLDGARLVELATAPDGSLWHYYERDMDGTESPSPLLVHELGSSTAVVSDASDGMPLIRGHRDDDPPRDRLQVGPDGTVWLETNEGLLASFDGTGWFTREVDDIDAYDIAPDGSAIVLDDSGLLSSVRPGGDPLGVVDDEPAVVPTPRVDADSSGGPLAPLETEELEPGVLRILSDGYRQLTYPAGSQDRRNLYSSRIVAGRDGSVWVFGADDYYKLGDPRTYHWQESSPSYGQPPAAGTKRDREAGQIIEPSGADDIEVAADGMVWYPLGSPMPWVYEGELVQSLWTFDGETWTPAGPPGAVTDVEVPSDGSVWASWESGDVGEPGLMVVRRLDQSGWADVGEPVTPVPWETASYGRGLHVSDDGEVWLVAGDIRRLEGGEWVHPPAPPAVDEFADFELGADGTPWIGLQVSYGNQGSDRLARLEDGSWTTYPEGGIPETGNGRWQIAHQVGPDGSIWIPLKGNLECGGLGNFDGETWHTYLRGTCIYAFDIAPDGSVWVHGGAIRWNALGDDLLGVRPVETYVISPTE